MLNEHILRAIDWFVPAQLRTDTGSFWRARIFAISHLLSPCFAVPIVVFLFRADPQPGVPFWIICAAASSFLFLPFGVKATKQLRWAAVSSVCTLTFLSVFGSFFYGGVSSPFLPWFLTALLLGFFYLGDRPLLVLGLFAVNLLGLGIAHEINGFFPELVPVAALSNVGVISVCAATLYTSMMAIYYASVVTAQSALRREAERHLVTAAKMRKAKEEAERSNEAKSVFLAKMNHLMRTPLNAVIGYSEILREDAEALNNESQMRDLERINSAGRHLLALVTDVLDVGKIASNDVELVLRPVDLAGLVDDVASTCRSLVTVNRNEFIVDKGDDLGTVFTDETRLRQIVFNLLSNAGKFTSKGVVTLGVSRAADTFVISVKDTGIGISRDNIEKLFTDFSQADASTSTKYGGTGLGLALSRSLCHLMGGEISVESDVGRGSTFTVRLPVEARPKSAAAAAPMPSPIEETEALGA
ncbi:MAG TPA: HAMP domain-containing sensor histidine kinase [Burkholderiales bacterium]|nr:HAMP domain-containing sensor histidine kinase [Burkholderiales bacterium]